MAASRVTNNCPRNRGQGSADKVFYTLVVASVTLMLLQRDTQATVEQPALYFASVTLEGLRTLLQQSGLATQYLLLQLCPINVERPPQQHCTKTD